MQSIFTNKNKQPDNEELKNALGDTYPIWQSIREYTLSQNKKTFEEWNCSNFGWSLRIKDKKRTIIYLLPREGFFKAAFVFGQKSTDLILKSTVTDTIKAELMAARVYAEGRGIRIDIKNKLMTDDIKQLIDTKLAN